MFTFDEGLGPYMCGFVIQVPPIRACGPHSVTLPNQISTIEIDMASLVLDHKHQNDTCHNEIGICACTIDIIQSSNLTQLGVWQAIAIV